MAKPTQSKVDSQPVAARNPVAAHHVANAGMPDTPPRPNKTRAAEQFDGISSGCDRPTLHSSSMSRFATPVNSSFATVHVREPLMPKRAKTTARGPQYRYRDIGERLQLTREALGKTTHAEFIRGLRIAHNSYSEWESGERRLSLRGALILCKAYDGVSLDWLYFDKLGHVDNQTLQNAIRDLRLKKSQPED